MKPLSLLVVLLTAATLQGNTITDTDRPAFMAQGSNWTVLDFEQQPTLLSQTAAGLTINGMNMVGIIENVCNLCPPTIAYYLETFNLAPLISGNLLLSAYSSSDGLPPATSTDQKRGRTVFTPTLPTYTLGFDYIAYEPTRAGDPPVQFSVTLSDGYLYNGSSDKLPQFLGFISSSPIM